MADESIPEPKQVNQSIIIIDFLNVIGRLGDYTDERDRRKLHAAFFKALTQYTEEVIAVVNVVRKDYVKYRNLMPKNMQHRVVTTDGVYDPTEHGASGSNQSTDRMVIELFRQYKYKGWSPSLITRDEYRDHFISRCRDVIFSDSRDRVSVDGTYVIVTWTSLNVVHRPFNVRVDLPESGTLAAYIPVVPETPVPEMVITSISTVASPVNTTAQSVKTLRSVLRLGGTDECDHHLHRMFVKGVPTDNKHDLFRAFERAGHHVIDPWLMKEDHFSRDPSWIFYVSVVNSFNLSYILASDNVYCDGKKLVLRRYKYPFEEKTYISAPFAVFDRWFKANFWEAYSTDEPAIKHYGCFEQYTRQFEPSDIERRNTWRETKTRVRDERSGAHDRPQQIAAPTYEAAPEASLATVLVEEGDTTAARSTIEAALKPRITSVEAPTRAGPGCVRHMRLFCRYTGGTRFAATIEFINSKPNLMDTGVVPFDCVLSVDYLSMMSIFNKSTGEQYGKTIVTYTGNYLKRDTSPCDWEQYDRFYVAPLGLHTRFTLSRGPHVQAMENFGLPDSPDLHTSTELRTVYAVAAGDTRVWAYENGTVVSGEFYLHPDVYSVDTVDEKWLLDCTLIARCDFGRINHAWSVYVRAPFPQQYLVSPKMRSFCLRGTSGFDDVPVESDVCYCYMY
jgi:hypothetical protein